jgi:hypothetical protein
MPASGKALGSAMKLGMKYGPMAYELVRHSREPAKVLAQKAMTKASARRAALQHAASVIDGSALLVFHRDLQVWVVVSSAEPLGSHPVVNVPLAQLLEHADLSRRIRPGEQAAARVKLPKPKPKPRRHP